MKGRLYCIGLGPGDPELVTVKALRLMKECSVWFIPQSGPDKETAGRILQAAANYADEDLQVSKTIVKLTFPMTRSEEILEEAHRKNAEIIEAYLDKGEDAALFTLGCPTVYASCSYMERRVALAGYDTQIVPGVTSFARRQQPWGRVYVRKMNLFWWCLRIAMIWQTFSMCREIRLS